MIYKWTADALPIPQRPPRTISLDHGQGCCPVLFLLPLDCLHQ
jgi:hypothetical protein